MPINHAVIDNPKSDRIKRVAGLARPAGRERSGRFLIEGPQSVREAVTWRPDVVSDLYVAVDVTPEGEPYVPDTLAAIVDKSQESRKSPIYVHHVTREVMAKISKDAQGVVAVGDIETLRTEITAVRLAERPLLAAFWQVRDPGNAGTVIRAADAAGCDAVVFVDECVDPLNPKVIRSTAGSLFHIPVLRMDTGTYLKWMERAGLRTVAADVYGTPERKPESLPDLLAERAADKTGGKGKTGGKAGAKDVRGDAVLFGNEARGLPSAILERMDRIVSIPIYGKAESLNLGTSAAVMLMSIAMSGR
ncbi:TrmH family RNA methyltransferase [Bifidobacterium saguinibicoloris]|uniref:TrmH family RNA methyltransferase n=1 Tax=Bifidobacterium saguinibicoloris TaxID=2834433 RepID=UPI001C58970D|nr:RNA methyltransferase [Bifidobacterium saguinibicoloris]MBW3080753.1 RNA methyltransferase [Bifidobacterium saguinibicoloris]